MLSTVSTVYRSAHAELDHRRQDTAPGRGPLGRGAGQRAEQPDVIALLRVPLDAEDEAGQAAELGGTPLDRLDRAVLRPRDRAQPVAEQVHGLVVGGGHVEAGR